MLAFNWPVASDEQFPKGTVAKDMAEEETALLQNLLTVRDEEQRGPSPGLCSSPVVEGSHHGLARSGGGNNEVAPVSMTLPFCAQSLEHGALVLEGGDVEGGKIDRPVRALLFDRGHEFLVLI